MVSSKVGLSLFLTGLIVIQVCAADDVVHPGLQNVRQNPQATFPRSRRQSGEL